MEISLNITFDDGTEENDIANALSIAGDRASECGREIAAMKVDDQIQIDVNYPGVQDVSIFRHA
jgi:hypothetical protein